MHRFHSRVLETMRQDFEEEISARDARILQLCAETDVFMVGERSLGGSGGESTRHLDIDSCIFDFSNNNKLIHYDFTIDSIILHVASSTEGIITGTAKSKHLRLCKGMKEE